MLELKSYSNCGSSFVSETVKLTGVDSGPRDCKIFLDSAHGFSHSESLIPLSS